MLGAVGMISDQPEDRPLHSERIRRSWEAGECAVMGLEEVASGEWRVTSLKKKQIPRCARNDNSRALRRVETG